jgi:hypothetical protein
MTRARYLPSGPHSCTVGMADLNALATFHAPEFHVQLLKWVVHFLLEFSLLSRIICGPTHTSGAWEESLSKATE